MLRTIPYAFALAIVIMSSVPITAFADEVDVGHSAQPPRAVMAATAEDPDQARARARALNAFAAKLERLWAPYCGPAGLSDLTIQVAFRLNPNGNLIGAPVSSQQGATDAIIKAASNRAVRAVYAAQPMTNLPATLYGPRIVVNFNAKQACSQR